MKGVECRVPLKVVVTTRCYKPTSGASKTVPKFADHKLSDRQAGSKGISGSTDCSMVSGFWMLKTYDRDSKHNLIHSRTVLCGGIEVRIRQIHVTPQLRYAYQFGLLTKASFHEGHGYGMSVESSEFRDIERNWLGKNLVQLRGFNHAEIEKDHFFYVLWAEAVATACYTLNRSLVHTLHGKTYYELLKGKKPNLQYFRVFGSLCYPTNDYDDVAGSGKPALYVNKENYVPGHPFFFGDADREVPVPETLHE
ncbi:hypothetical protein Tco_0558234 [Tanacetum coccineum]